MAPVIGNSASYREATAADMAGISHVRLAVVENALTAEQLAERGITNESVAASFLTSSMGFVAELDGQIVGFSIADRETRSIFALFVLPGYDGRGIGGRLHDLALRWLWAQGAERAWLTTGRNTRAAGFYERRGWIATGSGPRGDVRYEYVCLVKR